MVDTRIINRVISHEDLFKWSGYYFDLHTGCEYGYKFENDATHPKSALDWIRINKAGRYTTTKGDLILELVRPVKPLPCKDVSSKLLGDFAKTAPSSNRGIAAGHFDEERARKRHPNVRFTHINDFKATKLLKSGEPSKVKVNNLVNSAVVGYTDSGFQTNKCRTTYFTKNYFDRYQQCIPFFESISQHFETHQPEAYKRQMNQFQKPYMRNVQIGTSCFSTVTVNQNFRTGLHTDKGDFKEGLGVLVMSSKCVTGGELLFPEFNLAIEMQDNDILLFDTHLWHTTAPFNIEHGNRVSFVCYLRSKLVDTCKE